MSMTKVILYQEGRMTEIDFISMKPPYRFPWHGLPKNKIAVIEEGWGSNQTRSASSIAFVVDSLGAVLTNVT